MIWSGQFFAKAPGDGKTVPWHQDIQYWPLQPREHVVTGWIAIFDTDEDNGCMQVVPGTQNQLLQHDGQKQDNDVLDVVLNANQIDESKVVNINLKAGEMSLHTDALIHGSKANQTKDRWRCGLTMRVASPDVRVDLDKWADFCWTTLRGEDRFRHNPWIEPPTEERIPAGRNIASTTPA
jgi:ectoine hydroxylase-related dioxygenase (phytanoyl-CoA dioxygenase family)